MLNNSAPITVMVTGVGGGGLGEQLIKALRLSDIKYRIVGADISPRSKGLMEVDIPCLLPPAKDPGYINSLLRICLEHNVKALFIGSEPELRVVNIERARIIAAGIFLPINSASVLDTCLNKEKTAAAVSSLGFSTPRTLRVENRDDFSRVSFFPAILKPIADSSGSANVLLAQNQHELELLGQYLLGIMPAFIAQEYIGTPDHEYTVGVLCSMEGTLINSIVLKRDILSGLSNRIRVANNTGLSKHGPILAVSSGVSQGEVGDFPLIRQECEKIALKLGCQGAINIQCRYEGGKVYVFEINPRFSGTTSLRALVGYNEPDVLIRRHLLNQDIPVHFPYKTGYISRGLHEVFIEPQKFS